MTCSAIKRTNASRLYSPLDRISEIFSEKWTDETELMDQAMKEKAVFFATRNMAEWGEPGADPPSATLRAEEWRALRLLTLAGYTIVLFTPDRSAVYASGQGLSESGGEPLRLGGSMAGHQQDLSRQITPLLQATATLQIDLNQSWMVGDRLDSIEVGRLVGCKTLLLADGSEKDWEMTAMRWPDLLAGDLWELSCLIVMSDGSSVEGLSSGLDVDDLE